MTWTSFDRYARYGAIARAVRASLGPGEHTVLDVGDCAGHLQTFDEGLVTIGLDIEPAADRLPGAVPVRGDGARLPFPDDAFDAVVSSDVLEHVRPDERRSFLAEMRRVSRDLVVLAAPFDTFGVAGAEDAARRYALLALGEPQPQLAEHLERGLPSLPDTVAALESHGATVAVAGNGNLWDWLALMLSRFRIEARPALGPLVGGYDTFYNTALAARSDVGPFYRHLVVARTAGAPDTGASHDVPPPEPCPPALLAALLVADTTEIVRQDTEPRLDGLRMQLEAHGVWTEHELAQARAEIARLTEICESLHQRSVPLLPPGVRQRLVRVRAAVRAFVRG